VNDEDEDVDEEGAEAGVEATEAADAAELDVDEDESVWSVQEDEQKNAFKRSSYQYRQKKDSFNSAQGMPHLTTTKKTTAWRICILQ
jgi:hypothetical protein